MPQDYAVGTMALAYVLMITAMIPDRTHAGRRPVSPPPGDRCWLVIESIRALAVPPPHGWTARQLHRMDRRRIQLPSECRAFSTPHTSPARSQCAVKV
jgi:hypothetical protein